MIRLQWSVQLSFVDSLFVPLPPKIVFTLVYCFLNKSSILSTDSLSKHRQMVSIQWSALKECSDRYSAIVLGHFGTMRRLSGLRWDTGNGKVEAAQVHVRDRASEYVWRLNDGWWFIADNSMNAWGKPLIMQHLGCRSTLSRVNGRDVQRTATLVHNVFFTSAHHICSRQTSRKCTLCSSHNVGKVLTVTALNTEQCGILD